METEFISSPPPPTQIIINISISHFARWAREIKFSFLSLSLSVSLPITSVLSWVEGRISDSFEEVFVTEEEKEEEKNYQKENFFIKDFSYF